MSRKQAPRRDVVDVVRVGGWGEVTYRHRLDCGHVEIRKRPAKSDQIACESCLLVLRHGEQAPLVREEPPASQLLIDNPDLMDVFDPFAAEMAVVEGQAGRIRAGLANRLNVPYDSVDVQIGDQDGRMSVLSAVVYLTAEQAGKFVDP